MEARDIILRPVVTEATMATMMISATHLMLMYELPKHRLKKSYRRNLRC